MQSILRHYLALLLLFLAVAAQDSTCSADKPCKQGCCNKYGNCGFGPDFCGDDTCVSTCDAKAECGEYASDGQELCPLNVCCSKFGFCGTTSEFCGDGCQNGCDPVNEPSCGGASSAQRYIGYYESWNVQHACDTIKPGDIDANVWTHLNYAFALIGSDGTLTTMNDYDHDFYTDFVGLKSKNPSLKTYFSVGGWDAGGAVWSNMVAHTFSRRAFINSAVSTMKQYGFDGIDIDWEYPVADDRGGTKADKANFVQFLKELRAACGTTYGITATIPSSYWYMRGFDLNGMAQYIDWFNFMSYDIHGTWDGDSPYTKRVVNPHTNLTEIATGLDLLWRNHIDPAQVLLGLGFYGRSFTLSDPSCNEPGCPFAGSGGGTGGGAPGSCTGVSGTLSDYEMARILEAQSPNRVYNADAGVNWMTWGADQWVSFDDGKTLHQKADFANQKCLSGTFAWAVDLGGPGSLQNPNDVDPNGLGLGGDSSGNNSSGDHAPSGDVYISPIIYNEPNPVISCYPPCDFILPPLVFGSPEAITFPPWTTTLEVGWQTTKSASGTIPASTGYTRITQTTVIYIPPLTTTAVDVWNYNWTGGPPATTTTYQITSSVIPPPVTITDDPNPLNQTGVSHTDRGTRIITPPPYPHTITSTPTVFPHVTVSTGAPGPICHSGCGHKCRIFCGGLCGLHCAGIDIDGGSGFIDPTDPDPPEDPDPPGPPPDDEPEDPDDPDDGCDPDVDTSMGQCPNGNFPLWDPATGTVSCDVADADVPDRISGCQSDIDDNLDDSMDTLDESSSCCKPAGKVKRAWKWLKERATGPACPNPPNFPNNPPQNGVCHTTFTCDYNRWPNVCANAESAISERQKTSVLTFTAGSELHYTNPWYDGKFNPGGGLPQSTAPYKGWGLLGCDVEEYPFGSGNPNRNIDPFDWDSHPVLRLIPDDENRSHGNFMRTFYEQAGKGNSARANGLTYCVDFERIQGERTAPQQDYYLEDDQSKNRCGQKWGPGFLLVNKARRPNNRVWDPWWDDKLIHKAVRTIATGTTYLDLPRQYCQYPSPGRQTWDGGQYVGVDAQGNQYANPIGRDDTRLAQRFRRCDDPDFYGARTAQAAPPRRRIRRTLHGNGAVGVNVSLVSATTPRMVAPPGFEQADLARNASLASVRPSLADLETFEKPQLAPLSDSTRVSSAHRVGLTKRQAQSGSFLDGSAFKYLGCGSYDGDDPCYYSDDCGEQAVDFGDGDDGSGSGGSPSTVTNPPSTITPKPTITPSCSLQNEDPDQGINTEYCVCDGSTFPVLSVAPTADQSASCAYTTKPASQIHPGSTYSSSSNCRVCTAAPLGTTHCSFVDGCTPTKTSPPSEPSPDPPAPSGPEEVDGIMYFYEADSTSSCGRNACDIGGCELFVSGLSGCDGVTDAWVGPCGQDLVAAPIDEDICSSAHVWIHFDRDPVTIDFRNGDGEFFWCEVQSTAALPDNPKSGCRTIYRGQAPQTGQCKGVYDYDSKCGNLSKGNQMSELIETITDNINDSADHAGNVYESGVAIACTRSGSSAKDKLCAYYTNGRSGKLSDALADLKSIHDGCDECGSHDYGDGSFLTVDYDNDHPCAVNNGVTVCTCDQLADGHCYVGSG